MDLSHYHASPAEQQRLASLMGLLPANLAQALDVGARDGFISRQLAEHVPQVTALDLDLPQIDHARITSVQGNATALAFADASFDLVFCAEVLEHLPSPALESACRELARVARRFVLIGVPYRQDTRVGRLTCGQCGGISPPWGHVNRFDESRLQTLFPTLRIGQIDFVGTADVPTNGLSRLLMDWAGNPYGPYNQEERCQHCDAAFTPPPQRTPTQRVMTRVAVQLRTLQSTLHRAHGNWMHVLLHKPDPR